MAATAGDYLIQVAILHTLMTPPPSPPAIHTIPPGSSIDNILSIAKQNLDILQRQYQVDQLKQYFAIGSAWQAEDDTRVRNAGRRASELTVNNVGVGVRVFEIFRMEPRAMNGGDVGIKDIKRLSPAGFFQLRDAIESLENYQNSPLHSDSPFDIDSALGRGGHESDSD
jgi:hypothetical protein